MVFPIELGYYSRKSVSDALNLELEFKRMNLQPYVARKRFDSKVYARENFNIDSHFCHEPQMEDYSENCKDEHEVRKRLWSSFTLMQISILRLPINTSGVLEDTEEDVLDPEFNTEIEGKPILEIDWNMKGDDSIQTRTFNVVRRIERWLRKLKLKECPFMSPHESRSDSHILLQSPIFATNKITDIVGVSKLFVEKILPRRSGRSSSSPTATRVTRSRSKKKSSNHVLQWVVVDLDPSEEPEQIMDPQDHSEPQIQEEDTNEGVGTRQDPMNALVIFTSPDTQVTLPPKGSTNAPRWLEATIGKKRSVVSVTIPLEDMVSKCLGKASNPKKIITQAMLDVDDTTGH